MSRESITETIAKSIVHLPEFITCDYLIQGSIKLRLIPTKKVIGKTFLNQQNTFQEFTISKVNLEAGLDEDYMMD